MKKLADLTRDEKEHAFELYRNSIVIDCLQSSEFDDAYIRKVRDSGVTASYLSAGSVEHTANRYHLIKRNPDVVFGPVTTVKEIRRAKKEGRVAAFYGRQDANFLNGNLDTLPIYYELGLRIIQPVHNNRNIFADTCEERNPGGLSNLGVKLVEEMNKLKILFDASHLAVKSSMDGIEVSDYPVCTHSNARAVCENVRNKTDEEIHAIAEKDGVLGIVTYPSFVKWTKTESGERPNLEDILDHVDYIADLVGIKHVGIGLDLIEGWPLERHGWLSRHPEVWGLPGPDGIVRYAEGLATIDELPNLAVGLVARGYSDEEVKGVLGENWISIFKRVWEE
jgi:membrane dipeptidase